MFSRVPKIVMSRNKCPFSRDRAWITGTSNSIQNLILVKNYNIFPTELSTRATENIGGEYQRVGAHRLWAQLLEQWEFRNVAEGPMLGHPEGGRAFAQKQVGEPADPAGL